MRAAARLLVAVGAGALACARPYAPPGGEPDRAPPRLVSVTPEPLAVVAPGNQPVTFRFDERLSERGFSEALVTVSPLDSALRVDRSGGEVRVRIDGGWRPGRVYRVVLLPGIRDLFGNERSEQIEVVFSTGDAIGNTALAGIVVDRVTGLPAQSGVVEAHQRGAGARYTAIADSSGFYSLRYLPLGEYDVHAFDDLNRNRRRDTLEPVDSGHSAVFATPTDTVALIFNTLSPDTTLPQVARAQAVDSLHVLIAFDDFVEPELAVDALRAQVHALPDSTPYAGVMRVTTQAVFEEERRAAADSFVADSAAADTTAADRAPRAAADSAAAAAGAAEAALLPVRELVLRLDRPLLPGSYTITISGLTNLHGLTGGGIARFDVAAPPPPEPEPLAPPDTAAVRSRR